MEFENKKSEAMKPGSPVAMPIPDIEDAPVISVPEKGDSRIRHVELANGKKTWHVEEFDGEDWNQLREWTNPEAARSNIDSLRGLRVIKNEILDY